MIDGWKDYVSDDSPLRFALVLALCVMCLLWFLRKEGL
jgi:hypothetical protein